MESKTRLLTATEPSSVVPGEFVEELHEEAYSEEEDDSIATYMLNMMSISESKLRDDVFEDCEALIYYKHSAASIKKRFINVILPALYSHPLAEIENMPFYYDRVGLDMPSPLVEFLLTKNEKKDDECLVHNNDSTNDPNRIRVDSYPIKNLVEENSATVQTAIIISKPNACQKQKQSIGIQTTVDHPKAFPKIVGDDMITMNINNEEHRYKTSESNGDSKTHIIGEKLYEQFEKIVNLKDTVDQRLLEVVRNPESAKNLKPLSSNPGASKIFTTSCGSDCPITRMIEPQKESECRTLEKATISSAKFSVRNNDPANDLMEENSATIQTVNITSKSDECQKQKQSIGIQTTVNHPKSECRTLKKATIPSVKVSVRNNDPANDLMEENSATVQTVNITSKSDECQKQKQSIGIQTTVNHPKSECRTLKKSTIPSVKVSVRNNDPANDLMEENSATVQTVNITSKSNECQKQKQSIGIQTTVNHPKAFPKIVGDNMITMNINNEEHRYTTSESNGDSKTHKISTQLFEQFKQIANFKGIIDQGILRIVRNPELAKNLKPLSSIPGASKFFTTSCGSDCPLTRMIEPQKESECRTLEKATISSAKVSVRNNDPANDLMEENSATVQTVNITSKSDECQKQKQSIGIQTTVNHPKAFPKIVGDNMITMNINNEEHRYTTSESNGDSKTHKISTQLFEQFKQIANFKDIIDQGILRIVRNPELAKNLKPLSSIPGASKFFTTSCGSDCPLTRMIEPQKESECRTLEKATISSAKVSVRNNYPANELMEENSATVQTVNIIPKSNECQKQKQSIGIQTTVNHPKAFPKIVGDNMITMNINNEEHRYTTSESNGDSKTHKISTQLFEQFKQIANFKDIIDQGILRIVRNPELAKNLKPLSSIPGASKFFTTSCGSDCPLTRMIEPQKESECRTLEKATISSAKVSVRNNDPANDLMEENSATVQTVNITSKSDECQKQKQSIGIQTTVNHPKAFPKIVGDNMITMNINNEEHRYTTSESNGDSKTHKISTQLFEQFKQIANFKDIIDQGILRIVRNPELAKNLKPLSSIPGASKFFTTSCGSDCPLTRMIEPQKESECRTLEKATISSAKVSVRNNYPANELMEENSATVQTVNIIPKSNECQKQKQSIGIQTTVNHPKAFPKIVGDNMITMNINNEEHRYTTSESNGDSKTHKISTQLFEQFKQIANFKDIIDQGILRIVRNPELAKNLKPLSSIPGASKFFTTSCGSDCPLTRMIEPQKESECRTLEKATISSAKVSVRNNYPANELMEENSATVQTVNIIPKSNECQKQKQSIGIQTTVNHPKAFPKIVGDDMITMNINNEEHRYTTSESNGDSKTHKISTQLFEQFKQIANFKGIIDQGILRIVRNPELAKNLKPLSSIPGASKFFTKCCGSGDCTMTRLIEPQKESICWILEKAAIPFMKEKIIEKDNCSEKRNVVEVQNNDSGFDNAQYSSSSSIILSAKGKRKISDISADSSCSKRSKMEETIENVDETNTSTWYRNNIFLSQKSRKYLAAKNIPSRRIMLSAEQIRANRMSDSDPQPSTSKR